MYSVYEVLLVSGGREAGAGASYFPFCVCGDRLSLYQLEIVLTSSGGY